MLSDSNCSITVPYQSYCINSTKCIYKNYTDKNQIFALGKIQFFGIAV